jgi:hypothetical protein
MHLDTIVSLLTLYTLIKGVIRDIRLIRKKGEWRQKYIVWKENRRFIFISFFLLIFFILLLVDSLAYTIGSMLTHNTPLFVLSSVLTALLLYYVILLFIALITKIVLILLAK